jgi:hypothetical protein
MFRDGTNHGEEFWEELRVAPSQLCSKQVGVSLCTLRNTLISLW